MIYNIVNAEYQISIHSMIHTTQQLFLTKTLNFLNINLSLIYNLIDLPIYLCGKELK